MPLTVLAEGLFKNSQDFGKPMSSLVGRWISSIMPGGFGLTAIREYAQKRWGLGRGRQLSVVLVALVTSTAAASPRFATVDAAKEYLDGIVTEYTQSCGLNLQQLLANTQSQQQTPVNVDPATLAGIYEDINRLASTQHSSLSKYLGIENGSAKRIAELETVQKEQETELDGWLSEFGHNFLAGIKPAFDEFKLRRFNFSWNQARVDIVKLLLPAAPQPATITEAQLSRLADKCDTNCLELVRRLTSQAVLVHGVEDASVVLGSWLAKIIQLSLEHQPLSRFGERATRPRVDVAEDGNISCVEVPRSLHGHEASYTEVLEFWAKSGDTSVARRMPVSLKTKRGGSWEESAEMTTLLMRTMSAMVSGGMTFHSKVVLVTGTGLGSIGAEIIKKLLMGGATVIVTTSRDIAQAQHFYQDIYRDVGTRGSELLVLPFNQASVVDCQRLIQYIFRTLGKPIHAFLPLAAIPEQGIELDQLGEHSELAHRLMMTNVLRLVGIIIQEKRSQGIDCQPTQVLLPLSPNHGVFGGDGLYSESKLGLEGLLNRVTSEAWADTISVCGVLIGWTRGTGLMGANDIVAEAVESQGALTFTTEEMALNMLALLTPAISRCWEDDSVLADFSGCLGQLTSLKAITTQARSAMKEEVETKRMILEEDQLQLSMTSLPPHLDFDVYVNPNGCRQHLKIDFPLLPDLHDLQPLSHMNGMADLESTVVVVGFSELGPWGSARTRWQMEAYQQLSSSGYVEMACIMGLIKRNGKATNPDQIGWIDAKAGDKLSDEQISQRFGKYIMENAGIRLIESESGGYDPARKEFLQEVAIEDDLPEFDADLATAEALKLMHGEHAVITKVEGQDTYRVSIKAGVRILLPKAVKASYSMVAGLLPKGWNPARLGIPEDIVDQVDVVTIYALYCAAEALLSAGIEDSMEVFQYLHVSEVGNFIGSSLGGTQKNRDMFRNVYLDKQVQGDILQETNLNTPAAWVNMVVLGTSGPIKTPVGACATSLESLDGAVESITSGKTKMCLVGGVDAFHEDESFAFSTMKATVDSANQLAQGRRPNEMSRPTAETRAGFLEAEGGGVQILCSAQLALEMGLPIYAIVAGSAMASDGIGRSVPAPGQGLLTFAKESPGAERSPYLDVSYRRHGMKTAIANLLRTDPRSFSGVSTPDNSSWDSCGSTARYAEGNLNSYVNTIRRQWTTDFRRMDLGISPMRAALATWGLNIDDITVVSLHGTSTKANDLNEPKTIQQQMRHLGRKGAPIIAMCQKSVTGHPKGPAAAWMLNGCLQVLQTGLVPGNYACDNIDPELAEFDHLVFPSETIDVGDVKAFLLDSFGFGQKGAQMIGVAPKYLFAALGEEEYQQYTERYTVRKRLANRAFVKAFMTNTIVRPHEHPPYKPEDASKVLLDPLSRAKITTAGRGHPRYQLDPTELAGS